MKLIILTAFLGLIALSSALSIDNTERSIPTCPDYCTSVYDAKKECRRYPYCVVVFCGRHKAKCTYPTPSPTPSKTPTPSPRPDDCPDYCTDREEALYQCRYLKHKCEVVSCPHKHRRYAKCAPKVHKPRCKKVCRSGRYGRSEAIKDCEGLHPFCLVQKCDYGFWCADNPLHH